ncbi:MAG TPA: hypothetical protein VMN03_17170 [Burkholderiales bacterium]|nr:hypothetical protein [Burkholderiales bacterium]
MTAKVKAMLAAAAAGAAAVWGIAHAAPEQIVCQQRGGDQALLDCVLVSPSSSAAGSGAGVSPPPGTVTYHVVEPRRSREGAFAPAQRARPADGAVVIEPAGQSEGIVQSADLSQPPAEPLPYPYPSAIPGERAEVFYVIDEPALRAARSGDAVVIPSHRLIVTQSAPPVNTD